MGKETDILLSLRCDWCGEMNEDVGYNHDYKLSFGCRYCSKLNRIVEKYQSEKLIEPFDHTTDDDGTVDLEYQHMDSDLPE